MAQKDLTKPQIAALKEGTHRISANLYLRVIKGSRTYSFRYYEDGRQRFKSLGPVQHVSLEDAKAKARELLNSLYHNGKLQAPPSKTITFKEAAEKVLASHRASWAKVVARDWTNSLMKTAAAFGDRPISELQPSDIAAVLEPIWEEKPDTADRLQVRIKRVLDWATVHGYRGGRESG